MNPITATAGIIVLVILLFVWNRLPVVFVAMLTAVLLWATGVLDLNQALAGFGDPAVIFIASLFVVSAALEVTGVTAWAGQLLIRYAGEDSRARMMALMMLLVAVLTALITVNGAVAALLPVVVVIAVRLKWPSSQLLMPMVFSAHAGSLLALTGTPVNVLVSEAAADAGVGAFGFFEFAIAGVPTLIGAMLIMILVGRYLLPERNGATMPVDFSRHARTLVEQYGLASGVYQLRVRVTSPYVGTPRTALDLGAFPGLELIAVQDGDSGQPLRRAEIGEGDVLLVRGEPERAGELAATMHLAFRDDGADGRGEDALFNARSGLAEVLIAPRSKLIGQPAFPGMVTESGDLIVLAVQRGGETVLPAPGARERDSVTLQAGDSLLLQGTWKALDVRLNDPDVVIVDSPDLVRRQAVPLGQGATQAILILVAMVILLATGVVPPAVAGLLAAGAIVITGIMRVDQAYRSIEWTTVILVGAMMPLSTAMTVSGAADMLADGLITLVGDAGPFALLTGLFIVTAIMGQLISNTATALIMIPVAIAAALGMGISPRPVLMSLAIGSAAAFLTPIATPTNLMVMQPGGYQFGDYWKLGLPLLVWFYVMAVFFVPLVWRF